MSESPEIARLDAEILNLQKKLEELASLRARLDELVKRRADILSATEILAATEKEGTTAEIKAKKPPRFQSGS